VTATAVPRPTYPSSWAARRARAAVLATLPDLPLALCASSDLPPEAWHPERGHRELEEEAKALCQQCPERMECLGFALRAHPLYGLWGGMSEEQREAMVAKREHIAFVRP
jgi:WhiB family transcriptional regulator, redox-sensing transcriptional regulator